MERSLFLLCIYQSLLNGTHLSFSLHENYAWIKIKTKNMSDTIQAFCVPAPPHSVLRMPQPVKITSSRLYYICMDHKRQVEVPMQSGHRAFCLLPSAVCLGFIHAVLPSWRPWGLLHKHTTSPFFWCKPLGAF
jgi:hypothetical protein